MCYVSISNKTTEALEFLTGTVENMEFKHRRSRATDVNRKFLLLACFCSSPKHENSCFGFQLLVPEDKNEGPTN